MTGNLPHITILKTGDTALIFYGKHQIASVLTLQRKFRSTAIC